MDDTTPELKGKNLVIGDFKETDSDGGISFEAFFDNEPESDAMVNQYQDDINQIVVDIITKAVENTEKEDNNDSN